MSTSSMAAAAALAATTGAAFVIPAAWPLVAEMFEDQCDPEAVMAAGLKWLELSGELGAAEGTTRGLAHGLGQDEWKGKDRTAFDHKIDEYGTRITFTKVTAFVVGIAMICLAIMLFLLIVAMVIIAAVMVWHAAVVLLAMAGVITGAGAEAAASAAAVSCFNALDKIDKVEEAVALGLAAAITAMMGVNVGGQLLNGGDSALGDLGRGLLDAGDNVIWGTLSRLERDFNKALMNGAKWPLNKHGFNVPTSRTIAGAGGVWGTGTTVGGATGLSPGNITDNIHGRLPDYNDGKWQR